MSKAMRCCYNDSNIQARQLVLLVDDARNSLCGN
uniref:Uncharacterized protein n=1 Tax=Arundo donax TaxID=35708 RepID=A0A0A9BXT0_ARUDO